jgi:HEPN domain-containing protein
MTDKNVSEWITRASEDLKVITHEIKLEDSEMSALAVCFHAQQFVEKALKAYLSRNKVEFGKTHNLERLAELCSRIDKTFSYLKLGNLTDYAVDVRYPGTVQLPQAGEARKSAEIAIKARDFILGKLEIDNF